MAPLKVAHIKHALGGSLLALLLLRVLVGPLPEALAQGLTTAWVSPAQPIPAGGTASVWLVVFNTTTHSAAATFQARLEATLRVGTGEHAVTLELRDAAGAGSVEIPPDGYARREYLFTMPAGIEGSVLFSVRGLPANAVVLDVQAGPIVGAAPSAAPDRTAEAPAQPGERSALADYIEEHVFGYYPLYFIAGTESPNAKFQISFKYRLFSERGSFVEKVPALKGLYLAYTQTSLWDWGEPSSPFVDTTYQPEAFYHLDRLDGGRWGDRFRLDLQAGFQHDSNGKGGSDSRSLNLAYLEPTFTFGEPDGFQLKLTPRGWIYLGSLSDNPDIARFYGYLGLRAILGWKDGLQLSALGRVGDAWNRGAISLDLSYPLAKLTAGNLALFLYAQYFLGYGESLLLYNQRSSALRFGIAIYR